MAFKFRAQVALEFRARQDEAAQRQLALATAGVRLAEQALDRAKTALETALDRARREESEGGDVQRLMWYRNWITGQRCAVAAGEATLAARQRAWRVAQDQANRARRDLRALERYRDRVLKEWEREERRQEQKALDLLGALQYAARRTVPGGQ